MKLSSSLFHDSCTYQPQNSRTYNIQCCAWPLLRLTRVTPEEAERKTKSVTSNGSK